MSGRDGYALDLLSPVRHVATEMERAGLDGPAPTIEAMAATYEHTIVGDLARIRQHEDAGSDYEARLWLIRRAVQELGEQVALDGKGGYRLAVPFGKLRYKDRKIHRAVSEDEEDEKRALRAVYNDLAQERSFYVTVVGPRGKERNEQFTLHPLARAIPEMSEKEFADLAEDIKANGIRLPLHVMGGQVIDGRHRLAVAAALKLPVRVEEFTGAEDDARRHIVSLNVKRRHLTMAQRALIVREIFLPEAEAEAKARQLANLKQGNSPSAPDGANGSGDLGNVTSPPIGGKVPESKTAARIAAERSMGLATERTIERMAPVDNAPETRERVRRGEIKTATEARREALKETSKTDEPEDVGVLQPLSAYNQLGRAIRCIRSVLDGSAPVGDSVSQETFLKRVDEVVQATRDLEQKVQEHARERGR